jgi:hypothetical protein
MKRLKSPAKSASTPRLDDDETTDMGVASINAVIVLTAARREEIAARRGSGDWVLNPDKASRCRYLICCRKSRWDNRAEGVAARAGFLIGTIKALTRAATPPNARQQHRYHIEISDVAAIDVPDLWKPDWRNPVAYGSLAALGIRTPDLAFAPIDADASPATAPPPASTGRLSIAEAKRALAETFGVRPEDIEINIRG